MPQGNLTKTISSKDQQEGDDNRSARLKPSDVMTLDPDEHCVAFFPSQFQYMMEGKGSPAILSILPM